MKKLLSIGLLLLSIIVNAQTPNICFNTKNDTYSGNALADYILNEDLNHDNITDVVMIGTNSNTIVVNLGNGYGGFLSTPITTLSIYSPRNGILKDVNGDGNFDLAVCCGDNKIRIFLGNGLGNFGSATAISLGNGPSSVAAADFNNDGHMDLVVANRNDLAINILLGDGLGGFNSTTYSNTFLGWAVVAEDFNVDGNIDILIGYGGNGYILSGNGLGGFVSGPQLNIGSFAPPIICKDINHDNLKDLIVCNGGAINVLLNSSGGFGPPNTVFLGSTMAIALADANNDGNLDIFSANNVLKRDQILLGDGLGNFSNFSDFMLEFSPSALSVCDLNNDGNSDIITSAGSAYSIAYGLGTGRFTTFPYMETANANIPTGIQFIHNQDVNGDGAEDIIFPDSLNSLKVVFSDGKGSFSGSSKIVVGSAYSTDKFCSVDVNNDGKNDFIAIQGQDVFVKLHNGSNNFVSSTITFSVNSAINSVTNADFDGDGNKDIAIAYSNKKYISVLNGDGHGGFGASSDYTCTPNTIAGDVLLTAIDLNMDGKPDLVTSNRNDDSYTILINNGNGAFPAYSHAGAYSGVYTPKDIKVSDVNKDGFDDIVLLGTSVLNVYHGNGIGGLTMAFSKVISSMSKLNIDDLNNDGNIEISMTGNIGSVLISRNPNGTYTNDLVFYTSGASAICSVDLNKDGAKDLVVNLVGSKNVINYLFNTSAIFTPNTGIWNVCQSNTNVLKAVKGGFNYQWSLSGNMQDSVIVTGNNSTYSYTVSNQSGGCISSGKTVTVAVNPTPTITVNSGSICAGETFTLLPNGVTTYTYSGGSAVVSPTASTSYTITGSNSNGCSGTAISSITVNLTPTVTANSGSVCVGETFTIVPGGAITYTYSGGSGIVSPATNSSYTVTGFGSTGCIGTAVSSVSVNSIPVIGISSASICTGQTFTMNPTGALTYTFSSGSPTVSPLTNTDYTVTGADINGCTGNAISSITVNPTPTITVNSGSICAGQTFTLSPTGGITYTYSSGSSTITPATNSTYTIIGTNTQGCIGNAISTITVNSIPVLTVNSGSVCAGQTFTINPSGAVTYTFSSGSSTVTPVNNSTYTVVGSDANNCVGSGVSSVTVMANPTLTVSSTSSVCVGTSTVVMVTGANSYSWSTGSTTPTITITPTITANYTVTGTDLNNCSTTQTVSVTVNQTCQDVWPGDANSDGSADNFDVLELGLHFTQSGPARASVSNAWQSYFSNNWTGIISNGKNVNHSDCNGDGTIDSNDTLAIYNNYGLTHTFKSNEQTAVNPQLSIVPDQTMVAKGTWGTSSVYLGDASTQISNINGLAFTINFDQTLIEPNSIYLEYPASFLNTANQNLKFNKPDFSNGIIYTATTHTNNVNVSGNGKIAVLHYKVKSTLTIDGVLNISLVQAKQSNASGVLIPLTAGSATVAAIGASVGLDELQNGNSFLIYPNPAANFVTIQSTTILQKVELISVTGQIVLSEPATGNQHQLDLSTVANGVYFVTVTTVDQQIQRKKVMVQR